MIRHAVQFAALLLVCAAPATAQTMTIPAVEPTTLDKLTTVVAPDAQYAAVSEVASMLVVGCAPDDGGTLMTFKLGGKGQVAGDEPVTTALPRPDALKAFRHYPVSICAHPRLPLIYVWQDIGPAAGKDKAPPAKTVYAQFDHLLIYSLADGAPKLIKAAARGEHYAFKTAPFGTLATDAGPEAAPGERLYVPNLQQFIDRDRSPYVPRVGYVELDADGLPIMRDDDLALNMWADTTNSVRDGRPAGIFIVSKDIILFGGSRCFVTLDTADPYGITNHIYFWQAANNMRVCGHPTLEMLYGISRDYWMVHCMAHADGYLTLMPQHALVQGAKLFSEPVIDAADNRLVIGGVNRVHLLDLDDDGRFAGTQQVADVHNPNTLAVAYSGKFNRIYVAEEPKPDAKEAP